MRRHSPFPPRTAAAITVIVGFLAAHASARGASILVSAAKDNTLFQDAEGDVSNGQGSFLFVGKTGSIASFTLRRGLIAFDLSAIPPGSIVSDATLSLFMSRSSPGTAPVNISLHRAMMSWGEGASNAGSPGGAGTPAQSGDATWLHNFYDTSRWVAAGGDFRPTATATTTVNTPDLAYTWAGAGLTADVQGWVNNPSNNFGWFIRGDEVTDASAQRFNSSEHAANVPRLLVTYTIPEPSAGVLAMSGFLALGRRRCPSLQ